MEMKHVMLWIQTVKTEDFNVTMFSWSHRIFRSS